MATHPPQTGLARERLAERLDSLPREPGAYLMKDGAGQIFYVGKAIDLRARVRSYFNASGDTRAFIALLDNILAEIEVVVVASEHEALLLENSLIKLHQPRYNVMLRDDKNYLSLRLNVRGLDKVDEGSQARAQRYPKLTVTRRVRRDGALYFGPYTSAAAVRQTLRVINRHFGLRTCSDRNFATRRRPCILHQMRRCPGPCTLEVEPAHYRARVDEVLLLLKGNHGELLSQLREQMQQASLALEFERAAQLRDQIQAVERITGTAQPSRGKIIDRDLFALERSGPLLSLAVVPMRDNLLATPRTHLFKASPLPDAELLGSLLVQYYDDVLPTDLPDQILLPYAVDTQSSLQNWLSQRRRTVSRRGVKMVVPQRGHGRRLVEMAERNARLSLETALSSRAQRDNAVQALAARLKLATPPRCIECFDVSTFQGHNAVASKVCFVDGEPNKKAYRRYQIRTVQGQDDYAMLYEALARRLRRGLDDKDLPDLLLVDGGKGQLAVAVAALSDVHITHLPVAAIAKARIVDSQRSAAPQRSDERLFVPGRKNPIPLPQGSAERALVERIRDEAHRYAITYHRQKRNRGSLRSQLDTIPGVGTVLRQRLLRHFGSVAALRRARAEQIAEVRGVSSALAQRIVDALRPSS